MVLSGSFLAYKSSFHPLTPYIISFIASNANPRCLIPCLDSKCHSSKNIRKWFTLVPRTGSNANHFCKNLKKWLTSVSFPDSNINHSKMNCWKWIFFLALYSQLTILEKAKQNGLFFNLQSYPMLTILREILANGNLVSPWPAHVNHFGGNSAK